LYQTENNNEQMENLMKTTATMTLYEKVKNVARVTSITVGTLALLAYVSLLAVIIIL
jgi:hypothetical protein